MRVPNQIESGFTYTACILGLTVVMILAGIASAQLGLIGNFESTTTGSSSASGPGALSSGPTYSSFPDDNPDSGKFLGVAGSGTLTNIPIICHIGVAAGETSFDLDIFDGDIGGHWDQYYDSLDYMDFTLYTDPYKNGTGSSYVASWTQYTMTDDNWYLRTFTTSTAAKAPSGNFFYRFEINWRNPGLSSSNNYFKIRTTGQISIAKGDHFAIMGAPLNVPGTYGPPPWEINGYDPPTWAGDPDPSTNNIDANSYDGDWNFYFYVPSDIPSITFRDGDGDVAGDTNDANTPPPEGVSSGAPLDGPSPYDGCNINPNIRYTIEDPDGVKYQNLNPSGNLEWENFIISKNSLDNPDYLVSGDLSAGLWNMHFEGMDAHNMNFIEASFEIFTTTDPPLPVNPPPTFVPSLSSTVAPGATVNYAHVLTNKGVPDSFDLTASSSNGWTTRIYHDDDGDRILDDPEKAAGVISETPMLSTNEKFNIIVQLDVPSTSGTTTDILTNTATSQTEWNIQASVVDTTNVFANRPPVADAGGPYNCNEGDTIQLDGSGTYDPDGDYLWYYWDLDNDGYYDDSTAINPTKNWPEDGTFTVGLAVYDGEYYDYDSTVVNVANLAPEIYSSTFVYTLTQGSISQTIPAVEMALDPTTFYNYYSASAHTGFEEPYESKIFLYRDITTNDVSMFIIHDIDGNVYYPGVGYNSGSRDAQCNMDLTGIPTGAYLAQSDDPNEFTLTGSTAQGRWHWWYNTDGGAIGGLPTSSSWSITISANFFGPDPLTHWVYHYASGEAIELDMNQPITISYDAQSSPTTVQTDEGTPITIGAFARDWGSDDTPLNYQFSWNDPNDPGATSSGTTPWDVLFTATHTYYDNGNFNPVLTVTDSDGATDTLTFTVIVNNVVPNVDAGPDKVVDEGSPLSFSGTFSDPGAYDTHSATWTWGDGKSSSGSVTEENVPPDATGTVTGSHTYLDDGVYTVTLTVGDDDGGLGSDTLRVTVNDLGPTAGFVWSPEPQDEGSPVQFTDTSSSFPDSIVTWSWDFGGLGTSSMQNPSFTFMDDGTYTVTMTVTDDDGSTDTTSHDVKILDLAPIANFSWSPEPQDEGSPVQFTDLSYSFPDVIVSWVWTFGDGGTSSIQNPSHTYGDDGFYTVTLTVVDDDGSVSSISYVITIENVAPSVVAGNDVITDEGTTISFSGAFTDPGWLDTHTTIWDFGDGNTAPGTLTPDHAYGDNGIYTVSLTVTDDDGGVGVDTLIVEVHNVPPEVTAAENQVIDEGTTVAMTLATFTDPGWLDTHTATVDWGDGTIEPGTLTESMGSGTVFGSHAYGDNGIYYVTVTVTDDDGDSGSDTLTVTVNNLAPTIVSFGPFEIDEGTPLTFTADATDPGSDDLTITWVLDFGPTLTNVHYNDGTSPDPPQSPWGTFPFAIVDSISQSYGDNGNFSVSLTVEDDDGGITTLATYVIVNNVAPSVSIISGENIVNENSGITFNGRGIDLGSDDLIFTWEFEYGPTFTTIYYNDGSSPDPFPSPDDNPMDVIDSASHTYGDNGVFLLTLTVEDDDGGVTVVYTNITVNNVAPGIVNIEAYMYVNFTLRVAGEKWHSVGIQLLERNSEIWAATVTRYPGDPDEQTATIEGVKVDMTKRYIALVDYLPNDPYVNGNVWGGNPVWIIMDFEDGSQERLHHTFNVRQSDWDSDHWNHIDPWEVDFAPRLGRHNITFEASATDPGSDDLTFFWDFDDGETSGPRTYFNDGVAPDPYPSPEIKPAEFSEALIHRFITSGTYTITLTVTDDDGGIGVISITLIISL
jgi:PKD repeat protein